MPQFTRLPPLPPGPPGVAVERFLGVMRAWPEAGESFRALRGRLKQAEIWHRDHAEDLWRFLQVPVGDFMPPSPVVRALGQADREAALAAGADRLWAINPVLGHAVLSRVTERVHTANELLKYVESFAYPGVRLTGPQIHGWLRWAQGLELLRTVGVGLGLGERAGRLADRVKAFDVDDYLEEDEEEPELPPAGPAPGSAEGASAAPASPPQATASAGSAGPGSASAGSASAGSASAGSASAGPATPPPALKAPRPSPAPPAGDPACLRPEPPVALRALRAGLDAALQASTRAHLERWWTERGAAAQNGHEAASWQEVGLDGEAWLEDPLRALFRLTVSAGLQFAPGRAPAEGRAAFKALDEAGLLEALHDGVAPSGPLGGVDAEALMRASLVARRFAEHPDLPEALERCADAAGAFAALEAALGGLFTVELFWLLRALSQAGILRLKGMEGFTALPHRGVRDTLFRLGFLDSPYAGSPAALAAAAAAARAATGDAAAPEEVLEAFAAAAGCAYGCPQAPRCQVACRERL